MSTKTKKNRPLFHPQEISFCGFSGSGKTTLIEKLMPLLSKNHQVGYVKHDAHKFQMDHPGKDTFRIKEAGASHVLISNSEKFAWQGQGELSFFNQKQLFLDNDFVIIEGYKKGLQKKIVFLDDKILEGQDEDYLDTIIALTGAWDSRPNHLNIEKLSKLPYFSRDDIEGLAQFIIKQFITKLSQQPLYGLVLTGGQSSRMKQDKAMLRYHDKTQLEHSFELLDQVTDRTFVSCRENQRNPEQTAKLPTIYDQFLNLGPIGGILSAMNTHPEAAWLVVACDLPFLELKTLNHLIKNRDSLKLATCFTSSSDGFPEPLCAIYEPKSKQRLFEALGLGFKCPRKVLINSHVKNLDLINSNALDNINYPEEYISAQKSLESGVQHGNL